MTEDLRRWATKAIDELAAAGRPAPADLLNLQAGHTVTRTQWWWLLDERLRVRPSAPF